MNLFWSTRALTSEREDHLTEFFAAALDVSEPFRQAYADLVIGHRAKLGAPTSLRIQNVATQVTFTGTTCCPDMILTLSDGRVIACEHKLDALETMGPEVDFRAQLTRYLNLPVDGLVYVRASWKPPAAEVLNDPKYIRPPDREHFLWRDFYPLFTCDRHVLLDWLRGGFERLGFTPPHPSIGEMSGPDVDLNRSNRQNFAKLWQRTRSAAHTLGWKVSAGSIVELYMTGNASSLASDIFVSPAKSCRFLFRVTPHVGNFKLVKDRLNQACTLSSLRIEVEQQEVKRKRGKQQVVDVTTSLREILGAEKMSPPEIETRLHSFIEPLLRAVQK